MSLFLSDAGRRYGAQPSPTDHRDFGMATMPFLPSRAYQSMVDLEPWCGPKKDQLQMGACTAFTGTGNLEYLASRFRNEHLVLSPIMLYYLSRGLDGTLAEGDCGSTGRSICRAMNKFGVCLESEDSYDASKLSVAPTTEQLADALSYRPGSYHSLGTVSDIRSCLASGYPSMLGFVVYQSFESEETANSGIMRVPDKTKEAMLGGHEVLAIGYSDVRQAFKIRNSWGESWGDKGNFWMPYTVAADRDILEDAWIQHYGRAWTA
jgi:C1A family cysteine protease